MTRVILDIPAGKMRTFARLLRELGIDRNPVRPGNGKAAALQPREKSFLRKLYRSYLLFDWEFFSNELEFE